MGQFRSTYVSPHTQRLADRIRPATPKPAPKPEAAVPVERAPKARKKASSRRRVRAARRAKAGAIGGG